MFNLKKNLFSLYVFQGEQGEDSKVEGPPGPQGDRVSSSHHVALRLLCCLVLLC